MQYFIVFNVYIVVFYNFLNTKAIDTQEKHTMEKIPGLYSAPNCKHELLRLRDQCRKCFHHIYENSLDPQRHVKWPSQQIILTMLKLRKWRQKHPWGSLVFQTSLTGEIQVSMRDYHKDQYGQSILRNNTHVSFSFSMQVRAHACVHTYTCRSTHIHTYKE